MSNDDWLDDINESYKESTPDDLYEDDTKDMQWYLDELSEDPRIARDANQRLADMFEFWGAEYNEEEDRVNYDLAQEDPLNDGANTFFGDRIHDSIHRFVNKVKSGGEEMGPEETIRLFIGPVGTGKSDFDSQVREYFEDYTQRDDGRMYTFKWTNLQDKIENQYADEVESPMNQDPLVLIPQDQREDVIDELNDRLEEMVGSEEYDIDVDYEISNDQELDPESYFYREQLLKEYDGDLQEVFDNHIEVERLVADENMRQAIETFEPKDKKNQDETELTGGEDFTLLNRYSSDDPRILDWSGAFAKANRGILSAEEILKYQREFLYDFLHATQEQTMKPMKDTRVDLDQVIVGRTNMPEFKEKKEDDKMEAFIDRTLKIHFPYVTQYEAEADIYGKMLDSSANDAHIEPHTLEMAGLFGVMTRLEEPDRELNDLLQKAKAYNGEELEDQDFDLTKLKEEGDEKADIAEGMEGVSPRVVRNAIAEAITDEGFRGKDHLSAPVLLDYLEENLDDYGSVSDGTLKRTEDYIEQVRENEWKPRAQDDVRNALAYDPDEVEKQAEKYVKHAMAHVSDDTIEHESKGEIEPDENFLRKVEEKLNQPEDRKEDFRNTVSNWYGKTSFREDGGVEPVDNDKLRRAIESRLWEKKKHSIDFNALVTDSGESIEDGDQRSEWIHSLTDMGYSQEGAEELIKEVGAEVAKEEMGS